MFMESEIETAACVALHHMPWSSRVLNAAQLKATNDDAFHLVTPFSIEQSSVYKAKLFFVDVEARRKSNNQRTTRIQGNNS